MGLFVKSLIKDNHFDSIAELFGIPNVTLVSPARLFVAIATVHCAMGRY